MAHTPPHQLEELLAEDEQIKAKAAAKTAKKQKQKAKKGQPVLHPLMAAEPLVL